MNPIFGLLIKQLPRLLPVVKAMLERPAPGDPEDKRLAGLQHSIEWLAERSDAVERKLRRLTVLVAAALILGVITFVIVLSR